MLRASTRKERIAGSAKLHSGSKVDDFTGGHLWADTEKWVRHHAWKSLEVDRTTGLNPS